MSENPEPTPLPIPSPIPVELQYDQFTPQQDRNWRWILPGYWCGLFIGNALAVTIVTVHNYDKLEPAFSRWVTAIGVLFAGFLLEMLPATLILGIVMWLKSKVCSSVRFARFRVALLWAIANGVVNPRLLDLFPNTDKWIWQILIFFISWYCLYPAVTGLFLCYRSFLRD